MNNEEKHLRRYIQRAISVVLERRDRRNIEEARLRELIVPLIKEERAYHMQILADEKRVRNVVRCLILQEVVDSPDETARQRRSTGINALADIMKKLVADLKIGYTSLTTSPDQRESFRDHIIAAIEDTLSTVMPYGIPDALKDEVESATTGALSEQAEYDIEVDSDSELLGDDLPEPEEPPEDKPEVDSYPEIEGSERTGRNFSAETFRRIEPTIVKAYKNLADVSDRQDFYEYLVDNISKYFERFETEMTANLDSEEYAQNMDSIQQDVASGFGPPA